MARRYSLTKQQIGDLKAALSRERLRIERLAEMDEEIDSWMATDDAVATMVEREVSNGVRTRVRKRYDAIVDALHRIEIGAYGTCADCGHAIPYGRLIAIPEASQCITCAPEI